MSPPTLKSLYRLDGTPTDVLLAALTTLRCSNLDELQAKVKRGKVTLPDLLKLRLGGTVYRKGVVARFLFPRIKGLGTRRASRLPRGARSVVALAPVTPSPVALDHDRAHLALFTD